MGKHLTLTIGSNSREPSAACTQTAHKEAVKIPLIEVPGNTAARRSVHTNSSEASREDSARCVGRKTLTLTNWLRQCCNLLEYLSILTQSRECGCIQACVARGKAPDSDHLAPGRKPSAACTQTAHKQAVKIPLIEIHTAARRSVHTNSSEASRADSASGRHTNLRGTQENT